MNYFKLMAFLFFVQSSFFVYAQSLSFDNLVKGETYVITREFSEYRFEKIIIVDENVGNFTEHGRFFYKFPSRFISIQYTNGKVNDQYFFEDPVSSFARDLDYKIRPATQEEKDWLNACIEVGKFISKEEALKLSSKNRGEIKTAQLSLNPADRNSPKFKGNRNGFCFSPVYFNYQFVNCGGEVQMGVNIYTNPQANYQKHTASNGYMFEGEHYVAVVSSTNEVDIQEVEADLYYGNQFLGKINLNYIVGNFAGCYGETFQVLKDVGKDPTAKEYRENLDKFELKNIRILRGDLKISNKEREQIHKSLKYDQFGNPRKLGSNPTQNTQKKYDAFGNEIKSNNSGNTQKKYDAFGNPIKN